MDSQMIGRRGEKRFDLLCSDAGVTCNRSIEDDYGWDKLIEFPARLVPFASIDMQPGHVAAAVQVKTTTGPSRTVSISLSNALRYAKSDIPQFVVLVALDGAEPRYFARHVWGVLIADWLKAARQADANGVTATHQSSVSLGFSLQDERGPGLLDWIRAEVEAVPAPYAATKRRFVDTVGFEHGFGTAHMTLALRNADEMIDIQLGLRPHVDAKRFTYTSERFGIRARRPEIDESDVQVHLTPEGRRCTLRLEFHNGEGLTVPARLYSASAAGSFAVRVASRPLEVIVGPKDRIRAHASFQRDDKAKLEEICAFATLMASKPGEGVSIHASVDGQDLDLGSITMKQAGQSEAWGWLALGINAIRTIVITAGATPDECTMGDVQDAAGDLEILGALASDRAIRIDFDTEPDAPAGIDGFLAYSAATIGDQVFSAVAHRPTGLDEMHDGRRRVAFGPAKILWGGVASVATWSEETVRAAYQRQLDRLSANEGVMAVGDLATMVCGNSGGNQLKSDLPTKRDTRKPTVRT